VDIRRGSPTFGQSVDVMLTADNHRHFWVPEGFAHGFCVVSEFATFSYQCTALYDPKADAGIRWNDAALGIDWPVSAPLLSDKDGRTPLLDDNGQLGRSFLDHGGLAARGELIAASRDGVLVAGDHGEAADLSVPESLPTLLDRVRPDVIVNAAAYTAVDRAEQEEALATRVN